jgi:peptide/nickel transport system ATP-binding protein
MTDKAAVLLVRGLTVTAQSGAVVVDDVSFNVFAGQTLAIVGESGSGKSITARAITGLLTPGLSSEGTVRIAGRQLEHAAESEWRQIRGEDITWLPQDPFTMLNPLRRVHNSITDNARVRTSDDELRKRLSEVGIEDPAILRKYPFQLSGGLRQRVGIAAALSSDPRVLVADEPTTALDVTSERKVLSLLTQIQKARGLALVLITHDLSVALTVADRVAVMYAGRIIESFAPTDLELMGPRHPYTRALLMARPPADRRVEKIETVGGGVPVPGPKAHACAFAPRCEFAISQCHDGAPDLVTAGSRQTACIRQDLDLRLQLARQSPRSLDANSGPVVVSATDVRKTYGNHVALDGVTVEMRRGQIVGVIGESGSGKTTLARIVAGLETADSGNLEFPEGGTSGGRARPVQMVFQDPSGTLNPSHSVEVILRTALAAGGLTATSTAAAELLDRVGLDRSMLARKASSLSGGQRQRIAIARGLAPRARLLLCDEPTSALDVMVQAQILNLLRDIRDESDVAMLFVTHDLGVARQMTDYLYVLREGRCVEHGPTEAVFEAPQHEYTRSLIHVAQFEKS